MLNSFELKQENAYFLEEILSQELNFPVTKTQERNFLSCLKHTSIFSLFKVLDIT